MNRTLLRIAALIAVLVVVAVAFVIVSHRSAAPPSPTAGDAPSVTLAVARNGTFVQRVELQGRVGGPAGSSSKVSFAQAGVLHVVDVTVGEPVRAGQPLAELDRAALNAALEAAQADAQAAGSVQSARARAAVAADKLAALEHAGPAARSGRIAAASADRQAALKVATDQTELEREQTLFAAGVVAGKDVDAARAQLASDRADQQAANARVAAASVDFQTALKQARADAAGAQSDVQTARGQRAAAQARLNAAQIAFANGVLTAPADGVVLAVLKHPGEAVDPSIPVIDVGPAQTNVATLTAPASTAQRVHAGDRVSLRVASGTATGTVTAVVPAVDPAAQLGTIVVSGVPPNAVPGDALSATIAIGRSRGVLVPSSAIVEDPQTGKTVVFVHVAHPKAGDSPFASREVVVGDSDAMNALVAAGLHAGERVAAQGSYLLLAPAGG